MGFDFALTPRQISVSAAHDIVRRLPQGALSVGVFRNELPQRIVEIANTIGLSAVQIDGPASSDELSYVAERVNTVLRMVPDGTDRLDASAGVDYLVLPEVDGPTLWPTRWNFFMASDPRAPVIASGGLNSSSVVDVRLQNFPVFGVDVRAGVESAPGVIDPGDSGEFIASARWAYDGHTYVERHTSTSGTSDYGVESSSKDHAAVVSTKAKRVGQDDVNVGGTGLADYDVQCDLGIDHGGARGRRNQLVLERRNRGHSFEGSRRTQVGALGDRP